MAFALADGTTWTGTVDTRTWTAHGTALTVPTFTPRMRLEYATRSGGSWGTATDYSDYLMSYRVSRKVADWYMGPRAATGSILVDDTDGTHRCPVGGKVTLKVQVPSGTVTIFEGIVTEQVRNLDANKFPTVSVYVTDWFGFEAQAIHTVAADDTDTTSTLLSDAITALSWGPKSSQWATGGVTQKVEAGDYNFPDFLSTLIRGELGMLWVTREGEWAYAQAGWWNDDRTTAAAAIGDSSPPDSYDYLFPLRSTEPTKALRKVINSAVWETPYAYSESQSSSDATSQGLYQERRYTDTVNLTADTDAESGTWRLVNLYADPEQRITSVEFPADLSEDAMEYAAIAEITDFVNVAMESLSGYDSEWIRCHVTGVAQHWHPLYGWTVTLTVASSLYEDWESWVLGTSTLGVTTVLGFA